MKPVSVASPPKPMTPVVSEVKTEKPVTEAAPATPAAPAGPSQSMIQNAIQATLSKIKADKSLE